MVIQNACPRFSRFTLLLSVIPGSLGRPKRSGPPRHGHLRQTLRRVFKGNGYRFM
jgi:hypothetical protein